MQEKTPTRLEINKEKTMQNVTEYVEKNIAWDKLQTINKNKERDLTLAHQFKTKMDSLLNDAASCVENRDYTAAIDKLEEAKDLASGITWYRCTNTKHQDGSVDLIRDATMQDLVGEDKAAQEHISTLIRNVGILRGTEELMKTTIKGRKILDKQKPVLPDVHDVTSDNMDEQSNGKSSKGKKSKYIIKETKIGECKNIMASAIRNSTSDNINGGYFSFEEKDYIEYLRKAIKKESRIKNKSNKMDWTRQNIAILDNQYHATTLTTQYGADSKPVIMSESSIMMLGFSTAQVGIYNYIHNSGGRKVAYQEQGIAEDKDMKSIARHYNAMHKYQRKLISDVVIHVKDQDKIVPACSDGIDCVKNPRHDVVIAHQQFRQKEQPPQVITSSYSMDGLEGNTQSKKNQLSSLFPGGIKINLTVLGSPEFIMGIPNLFSKNRRLYNDLKAQEKLDENFSVDVSSLSAAKFLTIDNLGSFHKKLINTGKFLHRKCSQEISNLEKKIKEMLQESIKHPEGSIERIKIEADIVIARSNVSNLQNLKKINSYLAKNKSSKQSLDEVNTCIHNIDENFIIPFGLSKSDLRNMVEAQRVIKKIQYKGSSNSRNQEIAAIKPIANNIIDKINQYQALDDNKIPQSDTVNITTSARSGITALVSLKATQQSICSALGLTSSDKENVSIINNNFKAQLGAGHTKYHFNAMRVHGVCGIDRKDIKDALSKSDPLYLALVDEHDTGRTLEDGNKIQRMWNKIGNTMHNITDPKQKHSFLFRLCKFIIAVLIFPIKLVISGAKDLYYTTKDWIQGREYNNDARHFVCSGLPELDKSQNLSIDEKNIKQNIEIERNRYNESLNPFSTSYTEKHNTKKMQYNDALNPFSSNYQPSSQSIGYDENKNPFAENNVKTFGKQHSTISTKQFGNDAVPAPSKERQNSVETYDENKNPFAENNVKTFGKQHSTISTKQFGNDEEMHASTTQHEKISNIPSWANKLRTRLSKGSDSKTI